MKAVITYHQLPQRGAIGNTIGADGRGDYAVIIEADDYVTLHNKSHDVAVELANKGNIKNIIVVVEGSGYYDTIQEIKL